MTRRAIACAIVLLLASSGCGEEGDSWHAGPVDLSPTPIVLRPEHPLVVGGVACNLCVAVPMGYAAVPDTAHRVRAPDGRVVRVNVALFTPAGERRENLLRSYVSSGPERPLRLCFGVPDIDPAGLAFTAVELSATAPLRVEQVEWAVTRWGSL